MTDDGPIIDIRTGKPATEKQLANREKVRQALRAKNNKPASHIPAMGAGWGGEAKGRGKDLRIAANRAGPEQRKVGQARRLEQAEALLDVIIDAALDPTQPAGVRIMAAREARNQIVGTPVVKQITAEATGLEHWALEAIEIEKARSGS